ncbi:hypothetical protein F2Q68_00004018 [Brassica cretica]|uniref:Uncharacterized protein n=1 Tax=Brassica cretica TaxID=69181 RepID=A0A8S9JDN5_BRACR|nr:hypothetical protein F2Q68_00004018 [Brassica cretica]
MVFFFWFGPNPSVSVGQKESRRLLRYCGSRPLGVADAGGVAGGVKASGLAQALVESTDISGKVVVIGGRTVD